MAAKYKGAVCIVPPEPPSGHDVVLALFGMTVDELVDAIILNEGGQYSHFYSDNTEPKS